MMRTILLTVFLVTFASAIDHNVFKNCSRVPFCSRLREHIVETESQFAIILEQIEWRNDSLIVPLVNGKNETLTLVVDVGTDIARIRIQDPNNNRFELKVGQALRAEPEKVSFVREISADGKKVFVRPRDSPIYWIGFSAGPPFSIEFLEIADINARVILSGESFFMENTEDSQAFTFSVTFNSERLYGLFDHAWKLALTDTVGNGLDPFRMRNSDSWGYEADSPMALYGSHPVIYGHDADYTSGIFVHNAAEQWIDIYGNETYRSAYFMVGGGAFDLFVLMGPTPHDVVNQITTLTGTAHMPQLWTLGYHQCRFSYLSQDDVNTVAHLMVENRFPMDAIWLDGDHTDDYRWFHWNRTTFTDPVGLQNNISSLNKVCVSISDPHIAVDDTYDVYVGGKGYFVQWADGSDYQADCWPGLSSWIDYFLTDAADYYGSWYSYDKFNGSTPTLAGIWNDMNEPAIFNEADDIEKSFPYEVVHRLDDGTTIRHGDVHNIYGLMHTRATHKGLLIRDDYKKRPFILSRSTFSGSQTVAAMWTGDNSATWQHFANSITQCMTGNLVGMVFCGADIGGFIGDPSDELLQRWYQGAVWTPFFRGHSSRESKRREPYLFSEDVQNVLRSAIELRYKHIWHIYTLFYLHATYNIGILTPLFYQYPGIQERDTQMLIGRDIMAVAVVNESVSTVEVLFPGTNDDVWYRIDDDSWAPYFSNVTQDVGVDITSSPVFYRAGSIITRKDTIRLSTFEAIDDPYTLYVNLNLTGYAEDHFYIDDFTSFDYINGTFLFLNTAWNPEKNSLDFIYVDGQWTDAKYTIDNIVIHKVQQNEESGEYETVEKIYNTTRDGRPLQSVRVLDEKLEGKDNIYRIYF